jgi:O-antigen ligase
LRSVLIGIIVILAAALLGFLSSQASSARVIWSALALAVFALAFLNVDLGLYILIFSMLLSPEFIVGETGGATLGRGVTLRLEDFLLVIIGFSWFARNAVHKELGLFRKTPLNRAIFLYATVCILATGFGLMAGRVELKSGILFLLKYIEYFIVFFMVVNHVRSGEQVRRFVWCLLLTGFIVSVVGILQIPGGGRVSAPFEGQAGEPNTFGGYLLFMGMIAAGLMVKADNTRAKLLLGGLIAVMLPAYLFTLSRASYLGLIPALLVLVLHLEKRLILSGLIVAGLIVSPLFLPSVVRQRLLYTVQQPEHKDQLEIGNVRIDTSTSARIRSWKEALADWTQHPLIGHGVTGYRFVDAQFPRVLAETGILGLAAFLYLLYSIAKTALENLKQMHDPSARGMVIGYLAGFAGLLFHAVGANTFIIVRIMEPFWFFTGVVVILPNLQRSAASEQGLEKAAYELPEPQQIERQTARMTPRR